MSNAERLQSGEATVLQTQSITNFHSGQTLPDCPDADSVSALSTDILMNPLSTDVEAGH